MAEDQSFHPPENTHRLCANSCGFFGSPSTLNLCSKCFQSQSHQSNPTVESTFHTPNQPISTARIAHAADPNDTSQVERDPGLPNRCGTCRKRVGITGFKCRCGVTCCGAHRHAEEHGCTWDYKGVGREAIARENPVVKAEKVVKI